MSRRIYLALLFVPALAGCPRDESAQQATDLPFAGQEIRIAVPADFGFRAAWEGPLNEWAAQTGARYSLTEYAPSNGSGTFAGFADPAQHTLAIFPLEQAREIVAAEELAVIPASVLEEGEIGIRWQDLFAGLREKFASRKGQPLFIPLSAPVLVCYFRQDLLDTAGLAAPQTWDEYQQLLGNLASWAPGCSAVEPWSDEFRTTMFLSRAVSLAQHPGHYSLFFDIDSGEPLIDGPGFVRALEAARTALAKMPADVQHYNPADCRNELLAGRAALAIAYEVPAAGSPAATVATFDRPAGMKIGVVRLPGSREIYDAERRIWEPVADKGINRVTLTAFSGWGVGAWSHNSLLQTEAGWNALIKVCSANLTSGFPPGIVGLSRESQLQNVTIDSRLEGREAIAYANAVAQSLRDMRLVAELPVTGRVRFREALSHALSRALAAAFDDSAASEQALHGAARDWREIIGQLGAIKVRDSYRSSLGLSPKPGRE